MIFALIMGVLFSSFGKQLKVGVYQNPPLIYVDSTKQVQGFFPEILESIFEKNGIEPVYIYNSWNQCLQMLEKGQLDILAPVAFSQERLSKIQFNSENVFNNWGGVYTAAENLRDMQSVFGLQNRPVGIQKDDIFGEEFTRLTSNFGVFPQLKTYPEYDDLVLALLNHNVDAIVLNRINAFYHVAKYDIYETPIIFAPKQIRIGFSPKIERSIIDRIDLTLKQLKEDQSSIYYTAQEKWFGSGEKPLPPLVFWGIILLVALLVALLAKGLLWRKQIKRSIRQLEAEQHLREKTEINLQRLQENFWKMSQNSPLPLALLERNGQIEYINEQFEIVFGYSIKDVPNIDEWFKLAFPESSYRAEVKKSWEQVLKNPRNTVSIFSVSTKNGQTRQIKFRTNPLDSERIMILMEDVTEQEAAEKQIRENESKFRNLFENLPDAVFLTKINGPEAGKILDANPAAVQQTGYSLEELRRLNIYQDIAINGEAHAYLNERVEELLNKKSIHFTEKKRRRDGTEYWTDVVVTAFEIGGEQYALSVNHDITAAKKAEEELKRSEESFRELFENSTDAIYILNKNGEFLLVNHGAEVMYGYPREWFVGKTPAAVSAPGKNDLMKTKKFIDEAFAGKPQRFEFWGLRKNGEIFPKEVRLSKSVYMDEEVVIAFGRDITEQKRAELILNVMYNIASAAITTETTLELYQVIQKELRKLIDTTNFIIGLYNKKRQVIMLPYMKDELDYFEEVPLQNSLSAYVIKNRKSLLVDTAGLKELEKEKGVYVIGTPAKCWMGVPLIVDKEVIGIIIVHSYEREDAYNETDLALLEFVSTQIAVAIQRKRAEEEIMLLKKSVEQSPASVIITNREGVIQYVNRKALETSGYREDELLGAKPNIFKSGQIHAAVYKNMWDTILSGEEWSGELLNRRKDGSLYWEMASISPLKNEFGEITHFLAVKEDVTEKKKMEEQLAQAQRMESIGNLAGGVAHDFNNLLTVINGHADMAQMRLGAEHEVVKKDISAILEAGKRAQNLTSQLLAFGRRQSFDPQLVDVNELLEDSQKMLRRLIGEDIQVSLELQESLPNIKADPVQLDQIIMNLMVNARDAIAERQEKDNPKLITIKSRLVPASELNGYADFVTTVEHYVELSFSDTGKGMDEETRKRIFEPFFTTKPRGKGTGLGLATVYGIVKQNHGYVTVESTSGKGTTFRVFWPVVEEKGANQKKDKKVESQILGSGVILLVEDDEGVRSFSANALSELGYTVVEASDGMDALKKLETEDLRPHLLITDMIMPNMNGDELAEVVKRKFPDTKILFISGYTDGRIGQKGALEADVNFLAKPFSMKTLGEKVRSILLTN